MHFKMVSMFTQMFFYSVLSSDLNDEKKWINFPNNCSPLRIYEQESRLHKLSLEYDK